MCQKCLGAVGWPALIKTIKQTVTAQNIAAGAPLNNQISKLLHQISFKILFFIRFFNLKETLLSFH